MKGEREPSSSAHDPCSLTVTVWPPTSFLPSFLPDYNGLHLQNVSRICWVFYHINKTSIYIFSPWNHFMVLQFPSRPFPSYFSPFDSLSDTSSLFLHAFPHILHSGYAEPCFSCLQVSVQDLADRHKPESYWTLNRDNARLLRWRLCSVNCCQSLSLGTRPKPCEHLPLDVWQVWWFILTVHLTGSRITVETNLWICVLGNI